MEIIQSFVYFNVIGFVRPCVIAYSDDKNSPTPNTY